MVGKQKKGAETGVRSAVEEETQLVNRMDRRDTKDDNKVIEPQPNGVGDVGDKIIMVEVKPSL